ncbi:putative N-terminal domain of oxidoreductase [Lyophyllum shimeji]|uniref:N-terminal domain of oxidoreductase n=1 Tax=Lyophyllum shimeji TaxID=47721 RepID=A0A9P3PRZ1_LYOSH|nr:putative N-terminal domain of oxidoreductase [Lyophyllum shimeji]
MSTAKTYKRIVLQSRPVGEIEPTTFRTEVLPFDLKPGQGEVLVQVTWLSLDPAMRGYIRDARSYLPPVQIGEVMRAQGLGVIIEVGPGSTHAPGETVAVVPGMTEYAVVKDHAATKLVVPEGIETLDFLNVLGSSGMTAYFGIKDVAEVKKGDVLVVSGAAGSVGAIACQLGKRAGAKVYGIAGSPEKCEWLEKELGVDGALDYKSPTFREDFKKIGYIDVYFDNVGGDILDMVLTRLAQNARIALCGAISQYNAVKPAALHNYTTLISQRAKIQGFIVLDYAPRYPEAIKELSAGLVDGSIKRKFHIVEGGIEKAPASLPLLFSGGNKGKLVVKISEEPKSKM